MAHQLPFTFADAPTARAATPAGGFLALELCQLLLPLWYWCTRRLPTHALRLYLACLERAKQREFRTATRTFEADLVALRRLTGFRQGGVLAALARLQTLGLLRPTADGLALLKPLQPQDPDQRAAYAAWCGTLPSLPPRLPVPRPLLKYLARHTRRRQALIPTLLGVVLCCLRLRGTVCTSTGRVKVAWLCAQFGLAERTVQSVLRLAAQLGLLSRRPALGDERATGRLTTVNLAWTGDPLPLLAPQATPQQRDAIAAALRQALGLVHEPAPHGHEPAPHNAASPCTSRTCGAPHLLPLHLDLGNPAPDLSTPPVLHQIHPKDLTQLNRLHALYQQATARWHLPRGQRHWENFVALACMARHGRRNPGAYLCTVAQKGNWGAQITQEAEEEAQRWLKGQVV